MARPKAKAPARQYHISGQSIVRLDGRDFYLGPHDSPESIARYAVLIAIYQAGGMNLPDGFDALELEDRVRALLGQTQITVSQQSKPQILVSHVTALYREYAKEKYQRAPIDQKRLTRLCDQLDAKFASVPVNEFGPLKLKEFRNWLVQEKLARKYVNRLTNLVVTIFKHAVSNELVDVSKIQQLQTLEPLRIGQTEAHETPDVEPANLAHVRATSAHLSPVVKAMLRVQIATGMRPKEIFNLRPMDIDRMGEVWVYRPSSHKTAWRGKRKAIPIVGDARDAIIDYLARDPESFCFSPIESTEWKRSVASAERKTPPGYGNGRGRKRDGGGLRGQAGKRLPKTQYTATSYHQALKRAAEKAGVPKWHPYQLRHLTATVVRAALGIEDAQALLGHSNALMTAHYARESIEAATRAAYVAPKL